MRAPHQRLEQPPSGLVAPGHADEPRAAAERGDVAGGVAGAAGHDLGRVVVEDQDRRLARHARDLAVDELVDDQIAERPRRGRPAKRVDEREQARRVRHVGSRHHALLQDPRGGGDQVVDDRGRLRRRPRGAALRSRPIAGADEHAARADRAGPPAGRASDRRRRTSAPDRGRGPPPPARSMPGCGLRQSQACRYALDHRRSGWCGQ